MKKTFLLSIFLFFTFLLWGQEVHPILHKIAHDACPCIEQVNLNETIEMVDEAGSKCLEQAFQKHVSEILTTYGDDALEEKNVVKLGEQIGYILVDECSAFVDFSMKLAEEDKDEVAISTHQTNQNKARLAPLVKEASTKACKCANDAPSTEHLEEIENTFSDCLERIVFNDKQLEKKIKKALNVKKLDDETFNLFGEEVGLVLLKDCGLFKTLILGEIQEEAAENKKTPTQANTPAEGLMLTMSHEICDCLNKIPDDVSPSEAGKEGRKCLENIMAQNTLEMKKVYKEAAASDEEILNHFQKDMNKKLGAELMKNCPAFTEIGEKSSRRQ